MKRIIIVSELFYPEQSTTSYLLTQIARKLAKSHKVLVIAGPKKYEDTNLSVEDDGLDISNLEIKRISDKSFGKNNIISRCLRFLHITFMLLLMLKREARKSDKVLVVTNPAPLLLGMTFLKKRIKFDYTILVHDVFPENTIPANIFKPSNYIYILLKNKFDKAYRAADKLVVLGRDMRDVIVNKIGESSRDKVVIIENWATSGDISNISHSRLGNSEIEIQYAGNIGRVQGLDRIIDIISSTNKRNNIIYSFWGNGALLKHLQEKVKKLGLSNVFFKGNFDKCDQYKVMSCCDISLITLSDGMYGLGVPSKAYNIMQAGKPILFIGDVNSEIALTIKEYNIGFVFDSNDTNRIIDFLDSVTSIDKLLLAEMGLRAKKLVESKYTENIILNKYKELFENN
jgi:glycosyltransferase involved in cell wall biosynthesis